MNHKQLAELCERSYQESDFSSGGVEILINDKSDDYIVFAIRGTQLNAIDMIRNLAWWPKSFGGIDGHAGYVHGWNQIEHYLDIAKESIAKKPIIFTGHSAGGAIALIGALEALRKGWPVAECVTFGAPRSVDTRDIKSLGFSLTQYIHARDPVPSWLGFTDMNHTREKYLGGTESSSWWRKSLDCHGIDLYGELLG